MKIDELIKELIIEEAEAESVDEYECNECHMCEPGDRYCFRDFMDH